jgi:hypothetical protein
MDGFVAVAAEVLAGRAGMSPDSPEPQIAAAALLGLWRVQFHSLRCHLDATRPPGENPQKSHNRRTPSSRPDRVGPRHLPSRAPRLRRGRRP